MVFSVINATTSKAISGGYVNPLPFSWLLYFLRCSLQSFCQIFRLLHLLRTSYFCLIAVGRGKRSLRLATTIRIQNIPIFVVRACNVNEMAIYFIVFLFLFYNNNNCAHCLCANKNLTRIILFSFACSMCQYQ